VNAEQLEVLNLAREQAVFAEKVGAGWSMKFVPAVNGSASRYVARRPSRGGLAYETAVSVSDLIDRCRDRGKAKPEPPFNPNRRRTKTNAQ